MKQSIDLNDFRRQIYLYYSEDGLTDIAVGLVISGFGLFLLLDLPAFVGLLGVAALLVWYLGKSSLVVPRVGTIRPGRELKERFRGFFVTLVMIGIGVFALFLLGRGGVGAVFSRFSLSIFGLIVALGISAIGLLLDAPRFYIYGGLVFLAMAGGELLSPVLTAFDPFLAAVICAGVVILASGSAYLIRFLSRYPLIQGEE